MIFLSYFDELYGKIYGKYAPYEFKWSVYWKVYNFINYSDMSHVYFCASSASNKVYYKIPKLEASGVRIQCDCDLMYDKVSVRTSCESSYRVFCLRLPWNIYKRRKIVFLYNLLPHLFAFSHFMWIFWCIHKYIQKIYFLAREREREEEQEKSIFSVLWFKGDVFLFVALVSSENSISFAASRQELYASTLRRVHLMRFEINVMSFTHKLVETLFCHNKLSYIACSIYYYWVDKTSSTFVNT